MPSDEVSLDGEAYQLLKQHEDSWRMVDHYCNPGPIQYDDVGKDSRMETLAVRDKWEENIRQ